MERVFLCAVLSTTLADDELGILSRPTLCAPSEADVETEHAEFQKRQDSYTELEQRLRVALKARSLAQAEWRRVESIRSNAERALKPYLKSVLQQGQSNPVGRNSEQAQRQ